jgi:hypothetical protein
MNLFNCDIIFGDIVEYGVGNICRLYDPQEHSKLE